LKLAADSRLGLSFDALTLLASWATSQWVADLPQKLSRPWSTLCNCRYRDSRIARNHHEGQIGVSIHVDELACKLLAGGKLHLDRTQDEASLQRVAAFREKVAACLNQNGIVLTRDPNGSP
jgi:hypothetical protein